MNSYSDAWSGWLQSKNPKINQQQLDKQLTDSLFSDWIQGEGEKYKRYLTPDPHEGDRSNDPLYGEGLVEFQRYFRDWESAGRPTMSQIQQNRKGAEWVSGGKRYQTGGGRGFNSPYESIDR